MFRRVNRLETEKMEIVLYIQWAFSTGTNSVLTAEAFANRSSVPACILFALVSPFNVLLWASVSLLNDLQNKTWMIFDFFFKEMQDLNVISILSLILK